MKSLVDNFVSIMIYTIIIFSVVCCITAVEFQLISARHIHSSAINQIQSSYYNVDVDKINEEILDIYPSGDWYITSEVVNSVNNRQDRLVTLYYKVKVPLFNVSREGKIEGYAR